jgi:hypothetical protein
MEATTRGVVLGLVAVVVFGVAEYAAPAAVPTNVTITVGPGVVVLPLGARGQLGEPRKC